MRLRIFFTDMVAFVPSKNRKELTAVLPDTAGSHVPHKPLLAYFSTPEGRLERRVLNGVELSIQEASLAHPLRIAGDCTRPQNGVPTVETKKHMHWVSDLSWISPGRCRAQDGILKNDSTYRPAARFKLTHGSISTYRFVEIDGNIHSYFLNGSSKSRALADTILYELELPKNEITIASTDFSGQSNGSPSLTLRPAPGKDSADILVANVPPISSMKEGIGVHFGQFYRLIDQKPRRLSANRRDCTQISASSIDNPEPHEIAFALSKSRITDSVSAPENCYPCKTC